MRRADRGALALAIALAATGAWAADVTPPEEVVFTEDDTVPEPLTTAEADGYRGVQLFIDETKTNCLACHQNYDTEGVGRSGDVGPDLSLVGDRHAEAWFRALMVDSHRVFGGDTPMPRYYVPDTHTGETMLTAREIEDIVAYLMELHLYDR
jgi:sulfur oxidation c-type cytochrome SoxX